MARHALEAIPSITIVRETVPEQIEDALYRALAKVPADRFPSVTEFAGALSDPAHWTVTRRTLADRRTYEERSPGVRVRVDRRKSKMRRALYSATLGVPMLTAGWAGWHYWLRPPQAAAATTADAAAAARHVAVLYFDDLSTGGELASVADGLTEALIAALGDVSQLDVISKNGVLPFRGKDVEPDSIGRALKVGSVVRGSVESGRDGSIKVTVRLADAQSGADIGRTTFRQPAAAVLTIRDSLAGAVAEFLRRRIGEEVQLREARAGTRNVEAWTLVQQAARLHKQADSLWRASDTTGAARSLTTADRLLARAETLDPRWSEVPAGRAAIAHRRAGMAARQQPLLAGKWIDSGLAHAERALAANPQDAGALELRGQLRYARLTTGLVADPGEAKEVVRIAEQDLRKAIKADQHRASAWVALSQLSYRKLDIPAANNAAQRAYEEDAYLSSAPDVVWRLFATSYDMEQAPPATNWCMIGSQRFPADVRFSRCQLLLMTMRGTEQPDLERAWRLVAQSEKHTPKPQWPYEGRWQRMLVAGALARAGLADSARSVLVAARADRDVDPRGELVGFEAFIRTLIGDKEEAISLLTGYLTANPEHREGFSKLNTWWWRDLKDDPRFTDLVGTGD